MMVFMVGWLVVYLSPVNGAARVTSIIPAPMAARGRGQAIRGAVARPRRMERVPARPAVREKESWFMVGWF